jgi:IS5 family transposase
MGPKPRVTERDFFRQPLREQINLKHPLMRLAELIDWARLSGAMSESFVSRAGRPATSPRLIAGLLYLQHAFDLSDEEVVWQWVENPYWQVFTGETFLQTQPPIDPSSLTRWRKRLGEAGIEELLAATIEAAKRAGVIKASSVKRVIVDTTVMPKAIAHPTDSRLLERCREHLVKAAARHGLKLRQNYNREAPRLALQIGRYAHAKQYKRMRKALRTLRSRVGRVMRDVERQTAQASGSGRTALLELIARTKRILSQKPKVRNRTLLVGTRIDAIALPGAQPRTHYRMDPGDRRRVRPRKGKGRNQELRNSHWTSCRAGGEAARFRVCAKRVAGSDRTARFACPDARRDLSPTTVGNHRRCQRDPKHLSPAPV